MTSESSIKPLSTSDISRPSTGFTQYCMEELERRRNSGATFDEAAFMEAMELAIARLQTLEDEAQL
jgi:hypothetical protein